MNVEEKFGGSFHADPSWDTLESIIESHNILDIPPKHEKYTWNNKRVGKRNIKERLDQILIEDSIIVKFSYVT